MLWNSFPQKKCRRRAASTILCPCAIFEQWPEWTILSRPLCWRFKVLVLTWLTAALRSSLCSALRSNSCWRNSPGSPLQEAVGKRRHISNSWEQMISWMHVQKDDIIQCSSTVLLMLEKRDRMKVVLAVDHSSVTTSLNRYGVKLLNWKHIKHLVGFQTKEISLWARSAARQKPWIVNPGKSETTQLNFVFVFVASASSQPQYS